MGNLILLFEEIELKTQVDSGGIRTSDNANNKDGEFIQLNKQSETTIRQLTWLPLKEKKGLHLKTAVQGHFDNICYLLLLCKLITRDG